MTVFSGLTEKPSRRAIALTMGDPNGICGEITLKAWIALRQVCPFYTINSLTYLQKKNDFLSLEVPIAVIDHPQEALSVCPTALPVILVPPSSSQAQESLNSIDMGIQHVQQGIASALVTNPVNKKSINTCLPFTGHTEYLEKMTQCPTVMMLLSEKENLRVIPITTHVPLKNVSALLSQQKIITAVKAVHHFLKKYAPHECESIGVAALNPHGGELGLFGTEERDIIIPALLSLQKEGIHCTGPLPSDTLFTPPRNYSTILCMYHDQALIPLKMLDFRSSYGLTLGLPFIRTTPDHGPALDIAHLKHQASPDSLIAAILAAQKFSNTTTNQHHES